MSELEIVLPTADEIINEVSAHPRINNGVLSFGDEQEVTIVRRPHKSVAEQLGYAPSTMLAGNDAGPTTQTPDPVEYEIQMPGGGTETYGAGGNAPVADTMLLAKRKLAQLRMVKRIMKKLKRRKKLKEARGNKVATSRKKRDQQKASRKKNR